MGRDFFSLGSEKRFQRALIVMSLFFCSVMGNLSYAGPAALSYQGRILKSDGTALEYSNVSFIFQVTDPTGACVIYQEQVTGYNMANSGGVFDVTIGGGTVAWPLGGSFTILDTFNNSAHFDCGSCTGYTCVASSSSGYTPDVSDGRKLKVQFYDGTGWKAISPDTTIRSVPYAAYATSAQKLGTNTASDFVLKTGIPTCPADTYLSYDGTNLTCSSVSGATGGTVTAVTSSNAYLTVANSTSAPALTLNVGTTANTVAAGNDSRIVNALQSGSAAGGDLSGSYPNPTVSQLQGVAVSTTTPTSGQFFKYNGASWIPATIGTGDVSGLSASLSTYLTQSAFNGYVASASCSASQTMYWNSVTSSFQCMAINVGLAGDVTGSIGTAKVVALQNQPLDSTTPSNDQVLQWNGSKWAPATLPAGNPGTVISVTGNAPISVSNGTSTPTISISQASSSTNGYLSSADWTTFNSKQPAGNYVTALTGDVTASGPGAASATVAKLQGSTLSITTPTAGNYIRYDGSAFVNSTLQASDLSGTLPAADLPAFTGDVTSSAGSTTLTLSSVGTAGTYYKVTTDSKGRVTSGSTSLVAADIPNLDWSKITSGKPTTLSGYGITDSLVKNGGGVATISSGLDASKPSSPTSGDLFVATDSQKIYRYNGSSWDLVSSATGSGGTITSVTAGTGLTGGGSSGAVTLNVNAGTGANQIVQLDSSSKLPVVDGSQLTNLQASQIPNLSASKITSGVLAVAQGGTGQSTYIDGQLLIGNSSGNTLTKSTLTAGSGVSISNGNGSITISATGTGGTVTSVTGTAPISVTTGTTTPVISLANGTAAGQVHRWDGTSSWVATKLKYTDLINASSGSPWPTVTCTSGQAVTWSSASDSFTCTTLSIATSQLTGTLAAAQMPAFTGDVTSGAGSTALTLASSGVTAGTYQSVTVDAKGRVTAGTNPTTLAGHNITDGVKNAGSAVSLQSGLDASKPTAGTAGRFYAATDTQKIYFDNGTSWISLASNSGTGGTVTSVATGTGLSGGPITSTGTISLANTSVTAGSYGSATQALTFTVDAQGRLTAAGQVTVTPAWSSITSTPTTLAGYGITDSIKNGGGTPSIQTGADASKPASPSAGAIYFATDTNKIYQYNSGAWAIIASAAGAGGTITALTSDVSASGSGSVAATVNSVGGSTAANIHTAEVAANAATNANTASTVVKRDASGNFTAGTITANLTGSVTGAASLNVLKAGDSMSGNLTYAANIGSIYTAGSGSNTVKIQGPTAAIGTSYVLRLPTSVATVAGQMLTSDTSGNLSWTTPSTTATSYSGVLPVANGGTNSSTTLNNNRIMVSSGGAIVEASALTNGQLLIGSTGAAPVAASLTAGSGITITPAAGSITIATTGLLASSLADGKIWVGQSGTPTAVTPSGDATMSNAGAITVGKLQGTAVSATAPTTAGQILRYSGSSWTPNFVSMFDLRSTITGAQAFGGVGCTSSQTVTWTAATDNLACTSIAVNDGQVSNTVSRAANTFLAAPNGSAGAATYRAIAAADLPSISTGLSGVLPVANGGTGTSNGSITGTSALTFTAGGTNQNVTLTPSGTGYTVLNGNVGVGATAPTAKLDVRGQARSVSSTGSTTVNASAAVDWNNGNTQSMSVACTSTTLSNMLDGATYVLAVTDTTATTCAFSATGLTFYYNPSNGPRLSGARTVYTMLRVGTDVYVSWVSGFQ